MRLGVGGEPGTGTVAEAPNLALADVEQVILVPPHHLGITAITATTAAATTTIVGRHCHRLVDHVIDRFHQATHAKHAAHGRHDLLGLEAEVDVAVRVEGLVTGWALERKGALLAHVDAEVLCVGKGLPLGKAE